MKYNRLPSPISALGPDRPAVGLDDASGDVKAEAQASLIVLSGLPESFEDQLQHAAGDARSAVTDAAESLAFGGFDANRDLAALGAEFDRIREEVGEDLHHPVVVEIRHDRSFGAFQGERNSLRGGDRLERRHRFGDQCAKILTRGGYRQLAGIDAGDVGQVSDQPGHAGGVTFDALQTGEHPPAFLIVRSARREQVCVHDDSLQQVSQVVTHDAQEVVPIGEGEIGTHAFGQQVPVGLLSLQRQEPVQREGVLLAFAAEALVRGRPLPLESRVFRHPLVADDFARCNRQLFLIRLRVGLVARLTQHAVGDLPSPIDDRVGIPFEGLPLQEQGMVRLPSLAAQALIRLFALRAHRLVLGKHASCYHRRLASLLGPG